MKYRLKILLLVLFPFLVNAQPKKIDSLRRVITTVREDTAKIIPLLNLGQEFWATKPDTSLILFRQALLFSRQSKVIRYEARSLGYLSVGLAFNPKKNDSVRLCIQQAFTLARQNKLLEEEVGCFAALSQAYVYVWQKPDSGILFAQQGMALADKYRLISPNKIGLMWSLINGYRKLQRFDSSLQVCLDGILLSKQSKSFNDEKLFSNFAKYIISQAPPDTARFLSEKAIAWANAKHEKKYEASFRKGLGLSYKNDGNYPEALKAYMIVLAMYKNLDDKLGEAEVLDMIGEIYRQQSEYKQSLLYYLKMLEIQKELRDSMIMYTYDKVGNNYAKLKMVDSAVYYAKKSYTSALTTGPGYVPGTILNDLGELYSDLGEDSIAMNYFKESLPDILSDPRDVLNRSITYTGIAKLFSKQGKQDSSFYYARLALTTAQQVGEFNYIAEAGRIIAGYYKNRNRFDSAFYYQEIAGDARDRLFSQEKVKEIQKIAFDEQIRQQQAEEAQTKYRNRVRSYILFGGLAIVLLIAGILFRNNRQKQKTNKVLEQTLSNLKATQSQLIQSEKMASLGELTAGIAHEIQNPLNFVNNFSEVNSELISELVNEVDKGNTEEVKALANDIKENSEKINHHGKRAGDIVKGMLQHSRKGEGKKEPTDINALCDEYLRLAYHGLRAKDKSFNAEFKTDFDETLPKINVVPQDVGRVILNLINNAFYSVNEKSKSNTGFVPQVTIVTQKLNDKIEISVKDNGNGIPRNIVDKIFQPFFTTKPTGQGTGLGLSLSYDIVKAHGGEIKVETKEGEGSEFIIQLPVV